MTGKEAKRARRTAAKTDPPDFEALMERLEAIVEQLEDGELPLEQSIALYEEGVALTKAGMARLDEADRKVRLLLQPDGEDGEPSEEPFEVEG